jgi:hypothetical protein
MNFCIKVDPSTSQPYLSTPLKGTALLMDPLACRRGVDTRADPLPGM